MTGLIGFALILWGVRSLLRIRYRKKSLVKSREWAEKIIKKIELDKELSNKL